MLPACCSPGEDFGYGTHKTHITGVPVSTMDREDGLSPASFYVCYGLNLGRMIGIQTRNSCWLLSTLKITSVGYETQ